MPLVCGLTSADALLPAPFVGLDVGVDSSVWQLVVAEDTDVPGGLNVETALRHHRLVSQLCALVEALPLRYSPQLHDPQTVCDEIRELVRDDTVAHLWRAVWREVAGRVEMVLRLDYPAPTQQQDEEDDVQPSGAAYLRQRAEQYRQQQQWVEHFERLHGDLVNGCHDLIRAQHYKLKGTHSYSGSFLLEPAHTTPFEARLRDVVRPLSDDATPSLLGPWPPYSFTLELPTPARRR